MKAREVQPKKKRTILTFEPEPDVARMLDRARQAGMFLGEILNEAMRDCGERVITALAHKKAAKLKSLSFNQPEPQLAGFAE